MASRCRRSLRKAVDIARTWPTPYIPWLLHVAPVSGTYFELIGMKLRGVYMFVREVDVELVGHGNKIGASRLKRDNFPRLVWR